MDPLLSFVILASQACINLTIDTDKECGMFIYANNEQGAITQGGRLSVVVYPAPYKIPIAMLHTHPHGGTPVPSRIDRKQAAASAAHCNTIRYFVFSTTGEYVEFTAPINQDYCSGKKGN